MMANHLRLQLHRQLNSYLKFCRVGSAHPTKFTNLRSQRMTPQQATDGLSCNL